MGADPRAEKNFHLTIPFPGRALKEAVNWQVLTNICLVYMHVPGINTGAAHTHFGSMLGMFWGL